MHSMSPAPIRERFTNYGTAKVGMGFALDGIDDQVLVPASASLNLGTAGLHSGSVDQLVRLGLRAYHF